MRNFLLPLALLALSAAAPAPDPLLQGIAAEAKAAKPVAFERTERTEDGTATHVYVDRYDPARAVPWTLVSVDGRAPKPDDTAAWRKTTRNGVPGYHRLAGLLAAAQRVDATHYRVQPLPKGFISPSALGEHMLADLTVDTAAAKPFVSEVAFRAPAPFRLFVVAKVDRFEAANRYVRGADGVVRIVAQDTLISGSGPGMSGTQVKKATFTPPKG